ncbi:hypothetical protein GCM10027051_28440 [Niabella terrae]
MMLATVTRAQNPIRSVGDRFSGIKNAGSGSDSLGKRDKFEDSITITYRLLDTARAYRLDSSIGDFSIKYPIPADHYYLGNTGNPTQSFLFEPALRSGWDAGFHSLDVYKFTVDKARFYTVTRPYSEITYLLGTRAEQYIELMHTQNRSPNWNIALRYRMISAPGIYKSQKAAHSNYLITNWVHSTNKRYNNYFIIAANTLRNSENGGIDTSENYLDNPNYDDRYSIPTKIGGDEAYSRNFFNTDIKTGNRYTDFNILMRQQFDLGRKDSIVTDSASIPLFFPRVRLEHTIRYSKYKFNYIDASPDPAYYQNYYNMDLATSSDSLQKLDSWKELVNDFSIYTFPDEKNTQQFVKLGVAMQNLTGHFYGTDTASYSGVNIYGHAEYRNRTKNQKWDMLASGKLYFAGMNLGDYDAAASLQRSLGKKVGTLKLGFENVNRTPSYITNPNSAFYLDPELKDLKKENNTHLYANIYQPLIKLGLSGHYYLVSNYVYYTDFYKLQQYSSLFNVLQIAASKVFAVGRHKQWRWYADVYFQQVLGGAPVNIPTIFTRNRLGYEGNLGFNKLNIAFGFDTRYRTDFKGNNYSPVLGQFFYQDSTNVHYNLPDIAAYVHFRINSFRAFLRAENLNTYRNLNGNWGFTNNNFAAPEYPYPGLMIRFGVYWGFVN